MRITMVVRGLECPRRARARSPVSNMAIGNRSPGAGAGDPAPRRMVDEGAAVMGYKARELLDPVSQDSQDSSTSQLLIFEECFGHDANLALLGRALGVFSAGSSSLP